MDKSKEILTLFIRYIALLIIALNLSTLYKILTYLTIKTLNIILSFFTNPIIEGNIIHLNTISIEIVKACVAGSAFYLLLLLILSTAQIKLRTRIITLTTTLTTLFILNIIRILILISIINTNYFEITHWIFWHLISIIFVIGIWLTTIKIYKIKEIPVYSDIKILINAIKQS